MSKILRIYDLWVSLTAAGAFTICLCNVKCFNRIGDSAGGQLTLTLALRWKRYLAEQQAKSTSSAPNVARLPPIKFIIPIYPVV